MDGVRKASAHEIVFQFRPGSPELNCCSVNAARGLGLIGEWALIRDAAASSSTGTDPARSPRCFKSGGRREVDPGDDLSADGVSCGIRVEPGEARSVRTAAAHPALVVADVGEGQRRACHGCRAGAIPRAVAGVEAGRCGGPGARHDAAVLGRRGREIRRAGRRSTAARSCLPMTAGSTRSTRPTCRRWTRRTCPAGRLRIGSGRCRQCS